jgi:hypothetical protein
MVTVLQRGERLMDELTSPKLRRLFGEKFGFDLETYPPQVTVRKFMAGTDGNIHMIRAPRRSPC